MSIYKEKADKTSRLSFVPFDVGKGNPYADEGEYHYERTYWCHGQIGPNNETHTCSAKTFDKDCYICEWRAKMAKDPDQEEVVKGLYPRERQVFNIYDHDNPDEGVQIWDMSYHCFGKHLDAKIKRADEDDDDYGSFHDPEDGYMLRIGVSEADGGGFKFNLCSDIEFKKRKEALPQEIVDAAVCLDDIIKETPYEELKKKFLGTIEDDDDSDDDEEEDKKPKKGRKSSKKDDDDEEDEEPEDDDNDEDYELKERKKKDTKSKGRTWKEGDLVISDDEEYEVLKVSADGTSLTLQHEDGDIKRGVDPDDVKKAPVKEDMEDEEDNEPPAKKSKKSSKDEEDEDDPSAKKGKTSKKSKDDDDEEDDDNDEPFEEEDEDEEDEDDPPVKKDKSSKRR